MEPDGPLRFDPFHDGAQQGPDNWIVLVERGRDLGRRQEGLFRSLELDLELCRVGPIRASSRDSLDLRIWCDGRFYFAWTEAQGRLAAVRRVDWNHSPAPAVQLGLPPVPVELQRSGGRQNCREQL